MGMVFNSAETVRLCGRLNRRFSEKRLDAIRRDNTRLQKFINASTNKRTLARIAYKSGTYPGTAPTDNVAKRWFFFLQSLPNNVSLAIKSALEKALTLQNGNLYVYESMIFVAYEGTTTSFQAIDLPVLDGNSSPTGTYSMLFSLQTAAAGQDIYMPPADPGEVEGPNDPTDGVPDTDSGSGSLRLRSAPKKAAKTRGAKKKASKKKTSKKKKS